MSIGKIKVNCKYYINEKEGVSVYIGVVGGVYEITIEKGKKFDIDKKIT